MDGAVAATVNEEKKIICCCSPKIWTRVAGWVELIMCVLVAVTVVAMFLGAEVPVGSYEVEDEKADSHPNDMNEQIGIQIGKGVEKVIGTAEDWMVVATIATFLALAPLIILLLIVGNEKERPGFFIPWLTVSWIGMVLAALGIIGIIFVGKYGTALGSLTKLALSGFFLYAVHQRYSEVRAKTRRSAQRRRAQVYEKVHQEEA